MKAILKRWLSRMIPALTVIMAAVGVFHSVWRVVAGIAFVDLGMACICKCIFWPDKEHDAPVTQPVPPYPTMIPMPTVPESVVSIWPDGDVVERILQEEQREMREKLRGSDEDGDGVEV